MIDGIDYNPAEQQEAYLVCKQCGSRMKVYTTRLCGNVRIRYWKCELCSHSYGKTIQETIIQQPAITTPHIIQPAAPLSGPNHNLS